MFHPLSLLELVHDRSKVVALLRRHEHRDRPSDDFLGPIAIQTLRSSIPRGNDPLEGFTKNGIV
jgi:hypothetical protein